MKKVILSLVFVLGMTSLTMGSVDNNLTNQLQDNKVEVEYNDPDKCFELGAMIFFDLTLNQGYSENDAHQIALAVQAACNLFT